MQPALARIYKDFEHLAHYTRKMQIVAKIIRSHFLVKKAVGESALTVVPW
jgi:hypothetical protein